MKPVNDLERKALELSKQVGMDIYNDNKEVNDYYSEMEMNVADSAYDDIGYNGYTINATGMIYHALGVMHVVQRVEDWTVVRTLLLDFSVRIPYSWRDMNCSDVVQQWIAPTGERITLARHKGRTRNCCGDWDYWNHNSPLEVRRKCDDKYRYLYFHNHYCNEENVIYTDFAPGFIKSDIYTLDDRHTALCSKTGLQLYTHYPRVWHELKSDHRAIEHIEHFNRQVFLAHRNHYDWTTDYHQWLDMLDMIEYCNGNLEDARVICPANLKAAHDIWMERARIRREAREREAAYQREVERKQRLADEERWRKNADQEYLDRKDKYLVIAFGNDEYDFRVIQNVSEFKQIGKEHGQCIYGCGYYKKDHCVLMTCTDHKTGKYVSTITVDIDKFKVTINLGHNNSHVKDEENINRIVAENMQLFRDAKRAMQQCRDERDKQLAAELSALQQAPVIRMAI